LLDHIPVIRSWFTSAIGGPRALKQRVPNARLILFSQTSKSNCSFISQISPEYLNFKIRRPIFALQTFSSTNFMQDFGGKTYLVLERGLEFPFGQIDISMLDSRRVSF
jgi:hypothetical protein